MTTGTKRVGKGPAEVLDRLKLLLASSGCRFSTNESGDVIQFATRRFGEPVVWGTLRLSQADQGTDIAYEAELSPGQKLAGIVASLVGCWSIVIPAMVYQAWKYGPQKAVDQLLAGL